MKFSQSTHLIMCLSMETLTSIIRTGSHILVELTDLVNSVIIFFFISNDLTQMVNFPTYIIDCDSHSPALLDFFLSSDASICSTLRELIFAGTNFRGWMGQNGPVSRNLFSR